jgi:uncharacterized protein with FMN-binding domain
MNQERSRHIAGDPLLAPSRSRMSNLPPPVPGTAPESAPAAGARSARTVPAKRRKPARQAKIGALAISCAATGGLTLWFAALNGSSGSAAALAQFTQPVSTEAAAPTPTTSSAGNSSATATAAPTTEATGAVQAFDGAVVDTRYGPVQVEVQITDGQITDVAVLQYPDGDGKSVRINSRALPTLRTATLTAQVAQVDTVSGATYTSDAYNASLQSAIDEARSAGATTIT